MDLVKISQEQRGRFEPAEYDQLQQHARLLMFSEGADCVVRCGEKSWELHLEIICARSEFFRAAFAGGFMESYYKVLSLEEVVSADMVYNIILYLYLSNTKVNHGLDVVYGLMSDAQFYEMAPELFRHADYLKVEDLMFAIWRELKERFDMSAEILFKMHPSASNPVVWKKAMHDPMAGAVLVFDKANEYYIFYEPIRAEFFKFIERCYPVLCGMGEEFEDYLRQAPELSLAIMKNLSHIENSRFITPGPEARCAFCNVPIVWRTPRLDSQIEFGIMADCNGDVKYFCSSSKCIRSIRVNSNFNGK